MHYATFDRDGNKKGFRQGGEQANGGQNGYAGKHPVGTRADTLNIFFQIHDPSPRFFYLTIQTNNECVFILMFV